MRETISIQSNYMHKTKIYSTKYKNVYGQK